MDNKNIEKELRLMNYELYQTTKGTPLVTIDNKREYALPASEKREYSLLANSANLKKMKNTITHCTGQHLFLHITVMIL